MARSDRLRDKQRRFVEEYLVDLNATQAALRAGYSPRTASVMGFENLKKPQIAQGIQQAMDGKAQRADITVERVLEELGVLSYSNVQHYRVDENNNLQLTPDAPPNAMRAVSSVKRKRRTIITKGGDPIVEEELEFRLWDKNTALTNLGRHLRLFVDRIDLVGPMVEEIRRMAAQRGMTPEAVLAEAEAIANRRD